MSNKITNIRGTLPKELVARLEELYTKKRCESVYEAFFEKRPTTLRVNTLQASCEEVYSILTKEGFNPLPIPWIPYAFILQSEPFRISQLPLYKEGKIYLQSISSMVPPIVVDPQENERILDLCAAPGSKTTQLSMLMKNTGQIVALDSSSIRLEKLKANLKNQGVTNVTVRHGYGQRIWMEYPEYFDRALVDVACSMEGRICMTDPPSYTYWSVSKIRELGHMSQWLLRSAVSSVKPGGIIVFSTCTMAPEENEDVVNWLLKKEKGAVELMDIQIPNSPIERGITSWKTKVYGDEMTKTARITPSTQLEGFFVAKFQKTRSTIRKNNSED